MIAHSHKAARGLAARRSASTGFTVVELMVVIAIIVVLVGLVFVGMSGVRASANRTESVNSLRQMIGGYSAYMADNRQYLMPGYVDPSRIDDTDVSSTIDLRVRIDGVGNTGHPGNYLHADDTAGYVWRLAPYLDYSWQTMMGDYRDRGLMSRFQQEFADGVYGDFDLDPDEQLGIANAPSYGLNSIFVGGDTSHGGDDVIERHPWYVEGGSPPVDFSRARRERERLAAVRFTEVRNPARLIVFGPTGRADPNPDPQYAPYMEPDPGTHIGYVELRPPYVLPEELGDWTSWDRQQWFIGQGGQINVNDANLDLDAFRTGLPIVRWGTSEYPTANLDGSVTVEDIGQLSNDMRRWSPFVTGIDPPMVN